MATSTRYVYDIYISQRRQLVSPKRSAQYVLCIMLRYVRTMQVRLYYYVIHS